MLRSACIHAYFRVLLEDLTNLALRNTCNIQQPLGCPYLLVPSYRACETLDLSKTLLYVPHALQLTLQVVSRCQTSADQITDVQNSDCNVTLRCSPQLLSNLSNPIHAYVAQDAPRHAPVAQHGLPASDPAVRRPPVPLPPGPGSC